MQRGKITGELFRHLTTVLRLREGETILLADGEGHEAVATLLLMEKDGVSVELEPVPARASTVAFPKIILCQGLPKGEKVDLILQKATELGADEIILFGAVRSIPRLAGERLEKRNARWQRIVAEAARQCGRSGIPAVGFADSIGGLPDLKGDSLGLIVWEGEKQQSLKGVVSSCGKPESVIIIIGPEGGFAEGEVSAAREAGYLPVSLGERILRTETAGLVVISILQYVWGDLG